jgi:hypothetical protein
VGAGDVVGGVVGRGAFEGEAFLAVVFLAVVFLLFPAIVFTSLLVRPPVDRRPDRCCLLGSRDQ